MDNLDRRILAEISEKARESHPKLAKKLRISREVFEYRIKRLTQEGIIKGYEARVNLRNFIYGGYILLIETILLDEEKEEKIILALKNIPSIYYLEKCGGGYDFILGINVYSLSEFSNSIDKINGCFGKHKTMITVLTMIKELRDSFRPLFIDKEGYNGIVTWLDLPKKEVLDSIDKKLIFYLGKDASISSPSLVKDLGISEVAIRKRIKRLQDKKIILGFRTMIDLGKLDLEVTSLLVKTNISNLEEERKLQSFFQYDNNNTYVCKVIGEYNYFVTVSSKNSFDLKNYIRNLKNKFPEVILRIDILPLFELSYHSHLSLEKRNGPAAI